MKLDSSLEIFRPEIEGKVAIVTGGSTGIGSETAKTLAALGAEVHFCGRNVEAGKAIEALFPAGKIFVSGRLCESPGYTPKPGDIISVRGFGRMKYVGIDSPSKKGKENTTIELFI